MDVVFLGVNDVGMKIYEWLCEKEGTTVNALLTEKEQLSLIESIQPDLLLSVGFDHLVPKHILEIPSDGAINLHPSLLPYNRGKSPNVWSIVDGTPAGVTLHYMAAEFDVGPVIAQQRVTTDFADTGKSLHHRLEEAQFRLLTDTWSAIESGEIDSTPQDSDAGSYHSVDDFRELCKIDPEEMVRTIDFLDRIRALTFPPFNNAYLELGGEVYYLDVDIWPESETADDESTGLLTSY